MASVKREKRAKVTDFTSGPIVKPLLLFALPVFLGNIFNAMYNLVDSVVVGQFVGANALAAVGCCFAVSMICISVFAGFGIGSEESGRIDDPEICNGIGYIASEFNIELEKAESLIRFAVKSSPQKCSFIDSLAWVLFRQGKVEEAENMITLALKYREASAAMCVLYLHAAEIKAAGQKFDEAKIMLNKAKQLYDPDDESCFDYNLQTEKRLERLLK